MYVSELLIPNTRKWDLNLQRLLFDRDTMNIIHNMYMDIEKEDQALWMPSKDGKFSVKSTYNHLVHSRPVVPIQNADSHVWKSLWGCKATHRTKTFVWKYIRDIVPTRIRLSRHIQHIERGCGFCSDQEETLEHLLFECQHAKQVWGKFNIDIEVERLQYSSVQQWVISWFKNNVTGATALSYRDLYVRMNVSWIIWKDRCDAIHQGKTPNTFSTVRRVTYYLDPCLHPNNQPNAHRNCSIISAPNISNWHPPPLGVYKLNIDASFDIVSNELGTGIVLRDSAGICEGIKGTYSNGALSAEEGESIAVKEALLWARAKGLNNILIEGDAKVVMKAISEGTPTSHWDGKNIIKEIKWLANLFSFCSFSYVSRDDNQVADNISKFVRQSKIYLDMQSNFLVSVSVSNLLAKDSLSARF